MTDHEPLFFIEAVREDWTGIVGEMLGKKTSPVDFDEAAWPRRRLVVQAADVPWAAQTRYLAEDIRQRANSRIANLALDEVIVAVDIVDSAEEPSAPLPDLERLRRMPYAEYLRTPEWREKRAEAVRRAQGRCQTCDFDGPLEVHHRTYERRGAELPEDLVALCPSCHTAVHLVADARRGVVRKESRRATA